MEEKDPYKILEKTLDNYKKVSVKNKLFIEDFKKAVPSMKKVSKNEKLLLQMIIASTEFNFSMSEEIVALMESVVKIQEGFGLVSRILAKLIKTTFYYSVVLIFVVGYRKEIGDAAWSYLMFAFQNWPNLPIETKYNFLVIGPISLVVGSVITLLITKIFSKK